MFINRDALNFIYQHMVVLAELAFSDKYRSGLKSSGLACLGYSFIKKIKRLYFSWILTLSKGKHYPEVIMLFLYFICTLCVLPVYNNILLLQQNLGN